jgi:FG-GAP-like repeat/FG-GAP repeat
MTRIISVLLVLAGLTAAAPCAAARQFKKAVYYRLNSALPYQVISADFNNDGNLDLAVATFDGKVAVLLGKGNGQFHAPLYFSAGSAVALAAGDFNGDGNLDLAVVEYGGTGDSYLGIFLGDGHGNFRNKATYELGIESLSVAVADFNGDGHLDLAVLNELGYGKNGKSGSVMVFFGKGDGTFDKPVIYELPNYPYSVAAGDLNGDHYPDLVVAEAGGGVAVLMNNGHGKFRHTGTYPAGTYPAGVTIADLTHRGTPDLVIASGQAVAVLLGNGDGTFEKAVVYSTSELGTANVYATVVADFNLDGIPDIACVFGSGYPDHLGALFYGKGGGTFQSPVPFQGEEGGSGYSLATGDFNMDGAPDLAVSDFGNGGAAVLLNKQ